MSSSRWSAIAMVFVKAEIMLIVMASTISASDQPFSRRK